jgi:hypothetical protein
MIKGIDRLLWIIKVFSLSFAFSYFTDIGSPWSALVNISRPVAQSFLN